jgi:hypothetical protein
MKNFSSSTLRTLARKGITILHPVAIPGAGDMPFANVDLGYAVDDNGTHRIWTFAQVREAA